MPLRSLLLVFVWVLLPSLASAGTVRFAASDLPDFLGPGGDYWEVAYTFEGFDLDVDQSLRIDFEHELVAAPSFTGLPAQPDWSVDVFEPAPGLLLDGALDALAQVADPSTADPFVVRFVWLGGGAPGPQPWSHLQFDAVGAFVAELESGTTLPVPEPGSAALLLVAGTWLLRHRRRRAVSLGAVALLVALALPAAAQVESDAVLQVTQMTLEDQREVTRDLIQQV